MNTVNDAVEFQEVQTHHSGRLSYVPSQRSMIPSSSFMLRRGKRMPRETWNSLEGQEKFLVTSFLRLVARKSFSRKSLWCDIKRYRTRNTKGDRINSTNSTNRDLFRKRWQIKSRHNSNADVCEKAVDHEFFNTGGDRNDSKYRSCNSTNSTQHLFLCWKVTFKIHWRNWSPRDRLLAKKLRFWTRRLLLLRIGSSKIPTSKRRPVSRSRKPKRGVGFYEEDRAPPWSTTVFEWLLFMTQYQITLNYSLLLFMTIMFGNSIQDNMKFHCCERFHPMISWKVSKNWEYVSPHNSYFWRFMRRDRCPIINNWRQWWRVW